VVDTLRIKRRPIGGAAGAPASLAAAEIAYNEQDDTLYYGKGNSGGLATSIIPVAGPGAFAPIAQSLPPGGAAGQLLAKNTSSNYDVTWTTPAGGGNVSSVGTPVDGQWAQWTGPASIQGVVTASMPFVQKTGDTMTGSLTIQNGYYLMLVDPTAPASAGNGSWFAGYRGGIVDANQRWWLALGNGGTETGGNAGSDFQLQRYDDTGLSLGNALTISRATGDVTFSHWITLQSVDPEIVMIDTAAAPSGCWINGSRTTQNNFRWVMGLGNGAAETGSNAGSNFELDRYSDAGAFIDSPLVIARNTGLATVIGDPTAALGIATKQYVDANVPPTPWSTGDVKITIKTVADVGWVMMNDGTLGDASSNATTRANADCVNLFTLLWGIAAVQLYNSVGTAIARGASAAADWAAHCAIALPKVLGRALAISGAGAGLTTRALGSAAGAETETQTANTMVSHAHGFSVAPLANIDSYNNFTWGGSGSVTNVSMYSAGGSLPLNILSPSSFLNIMVKL
jgi:hypothetical protein